MDCHPRRGAQRDGDFHPRSGPRRGRCARSGDPGDRLGFRGTYRGHGVDPIPHMLACKQILGSRPKAELLWASTREFFNIFHAEECGCDIITVPTSFSASSICSTRTWCNIRARPCKRSTRTRLLPVIQSASIALLRSDGLEVRRHFRCQGRGGGQQMPSPLADSRGERTIRQRSELGLTFTE